MEGSGFLLVSGPEFSPRQTQALRLLAGGMMNARIADAMEISEVIVAKHPACARRKLNVKTREEAIVQAVRLNRIDLSR